MLSSKGLMVSGTTGASTSRGGVKREMWRCSMTAPLMSALGCHCIRRLLPTASSDQRIVRGHAFETVDGARPCVDVSVCSRRRLIPPLVLIPCFSFAGICALRCDATLQSPVSRRQVNSFSQPSSWCFVSNSNVSRTILFPLEAGRRNTFAGTSTCGVEMIHSSHISSCSYFRIQLSGYPAYLSFGSTLRDLCNHLRCLSLDPRHRSQFGQPPGRQLRVSFPLQGLSLQAFYSGSCCDFCSALFPHFSSAARVFDAFPKRTRVLRPRTASCVLLSFRSLGGDSHTTCRPGSSAAAGQPSSLLWVRFPFVFWRAFPKFYLFFHELE